MASVKKEAPPEAAPMPGDQSPELPAPANEWERRFDAAETDEARFEILGEKAASGPEDFGGLLRRALARGSEAVACEALQRGSGILRGEEAVALYAGAVRNALPGVRTFAVEVIRELPRTERFEVYRKVVEESPADTLARAVVDLGREATKPAFEILLGAYASPDPDVRAAVNAEVHRLVGQEFQSHEEARNWWAGASTRFNERLYETAPAP